MRGRAEARAGETPRNPQARPKVAVDNRGARGMRNIIYIIGLVVVVLAVLALVGII